MRFLPASFFFAVALGSAATPACFTVWSTSAVYTGGQTASYNNVNYTANWWTSGQNPSANNGGAGSGQPWASDGACSGSSTPPSQPPGNPPPPAQAGTKLFAPYVDMSLTPDEQLLAMQQQAGLKSVTMAFLVASGNGCSVGWGGLGGTLPSDSLPDGQSIQTVVQSLQNSGVQVILSFGGALGTEPALACATPSQLQALYQSVITRYGVSLLDFDLEGASVSDQASITRRDQALKALKAANPKLVISYTLPVLPTGLIDTGVNILTSAKRDGLTIDLVNIMAMDYGSAVDNGGKMGADAAEAATAVESQIKAAGLGSYLGITPMLGVNDTNTEIFQLTDAKTVLSFAEANSYVRRLSFWSLARDNGSCAGQTWASPACSGISQSTYAFSTLFEPFE